VNVTLENIFYRANEPDVTFETFDDEIIVINLGNGRYHNIRGSGTWLWQALCSGVGRCEAMDQLLAAGADEPHASEQVAEFIDRLTAEELLVASSVRTESAAAAPEAPKVYSAPLIETFTDMEHLLAIDPIHEVDAQGWPSDPGSLGT
jgi:hypothetical protein